MNNAHCAGSTYVWYETDRRSVRILLQFDFLLKLWYTILVRKEKGEISMKMYRVVSGKYAGRIGYCEFGKYGLVMFYPIEGIHPYRVCLVENEVEEI